MEKNRPLSSLLIAQFFGAFNDNAWKLMVALIAGRSILHTGGLSQADIEAATQTQTSIAFIVFTLPLMLFSLPSSCFADRISKRTIIIVMKGAEVLLMAAATAVLFFAPTAVWLMLFVLALMGIQSAIFSPAKYGILPELLPHQRLSHGNGLLGMWTFFAIIAGTGIAGGLLDIAGDSVWLAGLVLLILSIIGLAASFKVPAVPAAGSHEPLGETVLNAWRSIRGERVLFLTVLGMAFYWTIASLLGQDFLVYSRAVLQCTETETGYILASFVLGVGLGSVLAAKLSASKVESGLIPCGAVGMAIFTVILSVASPAKIDAETATSAYRTFLFLVFPLGISSGLILIPLEALLQWRAPVQRRGSVIALTNVLVFAGILTGSFIAEALSRIGFSSSGILAGAAVIMVAGTAWALRLLPDAFLRFIIVLLTHTVYRLNVVGRRNIPDEGGVLLVPNHVSLVDGLFLLATIDRPVHFLVESTYFHHRLLKPFMKALGAIPISSSGGPRVVLSAMRKAREYLDNGEVVCIFPEGEITRTGMLLPFRRGFDRIVKGRDTAIVPVNLDRVWGSIFSWEGGRFAFKLPRRLPYPVTVSFGTPLAPGTPVEDVRRAVQDLGAAAAVYRKRDRQLLHRAMIGHARREPFRFSCADATRHRISRLQMAAGAVALARKLRIHWRDQTHVGIMLPPSVAGAVVNFAATLSGRVSVNLNYTTGIRGLKSAATQADLKSVVTSREFYEKAGLEIPGDVELIWIEDIAGGIKRIEKLNAFLLAALAPCHLIEIACGCARKISLDDPLTIIFSSGSTGEPKGVVLSHNNVASNVDAVIQVMRTNQKDCLLGILPHFHSFGYMALWLAFKLGMSTVFHPNPLDAAAVGELIQRYRITLLIATPTFLQIYMRRCTPGQFGSLRLVIAGAEKLSQRLALAFEDTFGIRPIEGYGATECSPVIATNALDFRAPGYYQAGTRRGSVGQPLPGVAVRIVDPDREFDPEKSKPLPTGTEGMLVVKGENVMQGYLGRDDLTRNVLKDGWYVTGDIAVVNETGFITITDRRSRFSKIAGEMVPHGRVEEALHEAAGAGEQIFAVTAVPDEKRGERLIVLHKYAEDKIPAVLYKLSSMGLPNLFMPQPDQFLKVDSLPLLGTGKLDLKGLKWIAEEHLGVRR